MPELIRTIINGAKERFDEATFSSATLQEIRLSELITPSRADFGGRKRSSREIEALLTPDLSECEPKYFIPLQHISKQISLQDIPPLLVTQSYFERDSWQKVMAAVPELRRHREILEVLDISQFRLRCTQEGNEMQFHFAVKGRLHPADSVRKFEIPVELSVDRYVSLVPFADGGTVQKMRFRVPGALYPAEGKPISLNAEVDILIGAGNPPRAISRKHQKFALVDTDVMDPKNLDIIRSGRHSFGFLIPELDLHLQGEKLRKAFSMKRLAKYGYDEKAEQAAETLIALHKALLSK